ncbi:hypothetical protein C2759_06065 [Polynucleobacter sp. MG-Unter2-18]|uniref:hypothetical protein n=1 Tax=Polynucleobacter sp. MG-Unter2-18 TaxID=2081052 RepID=UPI001BFD76B0|nr:hypothetical protein [Polynucleobacter sp. MG-Unter2-18]QWD93776.1 hypothetical protein C2759_06065 [Polynucleobacter sp. MG-Unter2-18]
MNQKQLEIEENQLPKHAFELQNHELIEERLIWQHLTRKKSQKMKWTPKSDSSKLRD